MERDAVVFDGYTPEDAPQVHALYLAPDGAGSPWKSRGRAPVPAVTEIVGNHPLMRWVREHPVRATDPVERSETRLPKKEKEPPARRQHLFDRFRGR